MAYNATHVVGDISAIVIDFIGEYLVQFVALAGLLALAIVLGILWKKSRGVMPR